MNVATVHKFVLLDCCRRRSLEGKGCTQQSTERGKQLCNLLVMHCLICNSRNVVFAPFFCLIREGSTDQFQAQRQIAHISAKYYQ